MSISLNCTVCGHTNRAGARFCANCGNNLSDKEPIPVSQPPSSTEPSPAMAARRWQRRPGEIAARITAANLGNDAHGHIIIEDGLAAVALRNGQVVEQLSAGLYAVESVRPGWFSRGQETIVYLVDSSEQHATFALDGLWTQDPLRLKATCELALRVKDAARFCRVAVKDRSIYTVEDLRALLEPELRDAAQAYLADHTMQQLEANASARRDDFAVDVRERLSALLEQTGLEFLRVRFFDLRHPRLDQVKQQEEDLFLGPTELQNQKRLFDLYDEQQLHEIAKEEAETARFELRAQVWERMRRAVQQDRLNEATSAEEWARFVADSDRRKLMREDDLARFREDLAWKSKDRASERAHTEAMATLYAEYERKAAGMAEQFKFDQAHLQNELAILKQDTLGRLEIERQRIAMLGETESLQAARRREEAQKEELAAQEKMLQAALVQRRIELERAQSLAERRRIEREIEDAEIAADLAIAANAQAMMRHNQEEKLRIEREHWIKVRTQELEEEERRLRMRMEEKRAEREHELARMDKLAGLSVEALISVSDDKERAALIAELKRTSMLKDFSEDQILAMAAERQPQIIEAIKARYQAAADGRLSSAEAEKWKALADAAQQQKAGTDAVMKEFLDRQDKFAREAAERQERLTSETIRNMGDVAKSFAQKPDGNPTIVFGPGGAQQVAGGHAPGAQSTDAGGQVVVCPKCQMRSAAGVKFCANCGYQFYS